MHRWRHDFLASDAMTGEVLYRFNTSGSIGGGVITYALDGQQYVAATSVRVLLPHIAE
jgi:alcohol dehydrogenase (cytochrome c)